MPGKADLVGNGVQGLAYFPQNHLRIGLQLITAGVEHRPIFFIDNLDAQSFRSHVDQQLVFELPEHRIAFNQFLDVLLELAKLRFLALFELLAQLFSLCLSQIRSFLRRFKFASLDLTGTAGQVLAATLQYTCLLYTSIHRGTMTIDGRRL